jgi:ribosome-binding factor A
MSDGRRQRRVAETIKKHIAEALSRELYDPRLAGLIVTSVAISADLSVARVQVRSLVPTSDEGLRREIEKAANRAAPMLRRAIGSLLGIKKTPALEFFYDASQDALDRVEALLGEIEREGSTPK